jgi:hypothetical protein
MLAPASGHLNASLDELSWRCFSLMYKELRHGKALPSNIWLKRLVIRLHLSPCDCDHGIRWRLRFSITPGLLSPHFHLLLPWGSPSHEQLLSHISDVPFRPIMLLRADLVSAYASNRYRNACFDMVKLR